MPKQLIAFKLEPAQNAWLKATAAKVDKTVSALLRHMIDGAMKHEEKLRERQRFLLMDIAALETLVETLDDADVLRRADAQSKIRERKAELAGLGLT
jgi:uncharacterized protein (DUF1778 family)